MKVEQINADSQATLLSLMQESHKKDGTDLANEWPQIETAISTLLKDDKAGEAYLIFDDKDQPVGYMIMCRGFSLDYGGYFTWIEETYVRQSEQGLFRDQRFSP